MSEALNAFVIRGIASTSCSSRRCCGIRAFAKGGSRRHSSPRNIRTDSARRTCLPENPAFLAAIAAAVHRAYRDRAAGIEGQVPGHEMRIDGDYVVIAARRRVRRAASTACRAATTCASAMQPFAIRHGWRFGEILIAGTCNGAPFAVQVERRGLQLSPDAHRGRSSTCRCCRAAPPSFCASCRRRRRRTARASCSRRCPDCSPKSRSRPGQEVKAGERLVVIEAMKMQNVILAERDATRGRAAGARKATASPSTSR